MLPIIMSKVKDISSFIEKAKSIHGDFYSYDNFVYVDSISKSYITCPEHGDFPQSANKHLNGRGCPKCAVSNRTISMEQFVDRLREVSPHYRLVGEYISMNENCLFQCQTHGYEFYTKPSYLIRGKQSCRMCDSVNRRNNCGKTPVVDTSVYIERSKLAHKGKGYDYSDCVFRGWNDSVIVNCPKHGQFTIDARSHIYSGYGQNVLGSDF